MGKIITTIAHTSWAKILLVGVLFFGVYFALVYDDGSSLRTSVQKEYELKKGLEKQLKATKEAVANADRFEREVKEMTEQFNRIVDFMPEKMAGAELTSMVTDLSSKAGTHIVRTEPEQGAEKADFYDTSQLKLEIEGSFSQVVMFLSYLSRASKLMTLEHVGLETDGGADVESPKLKFSGTLIAYRYIHPKASDADLKLEKKAPPPPTGASDAP